MAYINAKALLLLSALLTINNLSLANELPTEEGPRDIHSCKMELPVQTSSTVIKLARFDLNNESAATPIVRIENQSAFLTLRSKTASTESFQLDNLNRSQAAELFGKPTETNKVSTFHLIAFEGQEPNIFHIDATFKNDVLTSYRVRGFGINRSQWRQVKS